MPVTLYDGGTQNTTINLKNGNGNALGTGFGFGTINGNDILVNSNNVEGNLELVQVIDMSNYTFEEISNYPDEVFVALKNFLVTNKIRAVGVEPIYSSASKMIAATLLLKDSQFALKSITNDGQGTVALTFIEHGLSGTTAVVERIVDATLTYTNGVPTSLDELINDTYTTSLGDIITLTPASATQGTLRQDEVNELTTDTSVKLQLNNELYYLNSNQHTPGVLVYTNNDYENQKGTHKYISVTISTRGWVMDKEGSSLPVITGTYSAEDDWISFDEQPKARAVGGTPYSIAIMSTLLGTTVMTMPIHIADVYDSRIYGATAIGKISIGGSIQVVSLTPYMVQDAVTGWTLSFSAVILTGAQAGTEIRDQLMPTLTTIQLIQIS